MSYGKRITWLREQREQELPLVLFDMDGTLTEPRKTLDKSLVPALRKLSDIARIGVVTGSDFDYLKQQIGFLLTHSKVRYRLYLLPCNGTKFYKPPYMTPQGHFLESETSMEEEIGKDEFESLMRVLLNFQSQVGQLGIPLTGHFVSYRGSMINWCPIGRNANSKQRNCFSERDKAEAIREKYLQKLKSEFSSRGIICKLGGETSFDIYPEGWDKTYALKHFPELRKNVFFVGDKCQKDGNDYEIYEALKPNSFETTSTKETETIIHTIIDKLVSS